MSRTALVALDVGLSRPVGGKSFKDIIAQGEILLLPTDGKSPTSILTDPRFVALPDGVVYSAKHQRLYFTNMGVPPLNDGSICSVRLDGSDPQTVLAKGLIHTPKQLALDAKNDKLYISDREGLRVFRCNLDGSALEALIQTGNFNNAADAHDYMKWCVGITLSHRTGLFYWTQKGPSKGAQGRIFCAPMQAEGKRVPVCVVDNLPEPIDLDVDEKSNTLYWTDRGELPYGNTFNRLRLDGSGTRPAADGRDSVSGLRYEVMVQNFDEAIGLAFDPENSKWFVADMGGTIWSFDPDGGNKTKVYEDKERAFTGIALVKQGN
jgi:sugar lactone lactonase YvrE